MKKLAITLTFASCVFTLGHSATINLSTPSAGSRVVTVAAGVAPLVDFTAPQLVSPGGYLLGTMTDEANASTFKVFGSSLLGTTSAYPTGGVPNVSITNNTTLANTFANARAYILFFSGATVPTYDTVTGVLDGNSVATPFAGIFKSTQFFTSTLNSEATSTDTLTMAEFSTAVSPTLNWQYNDAAVTTGASSYTGFAGGSARTGTVFDLGAAVPEPSTAAFGLLAGLGLLVRRRRD